VPGLRYESRARALCGARGEQHARGDGDVRVQREVDERGRAPAARVQSGVQLREAARGGERAW